MAEQISVSRDTLRSELLELELRIVNRIAEFQALNASKKDVEELTSRVNSLERWRYAWPSTAVLSVVAAIGTLIVYTLH